MCPVYPDGVFYYVNYRDLELSLQEAHCGMKHILWRLWSLLTHKITKLLPGSTLQTSATAKNSLVTINRYNTLVQYVLNKMCRCIQINQCKCALYKDTHTHTYIYGWFITRYVTPCSLIEGD
jgi:hypothetical protein